MSSEQSRKPLSTSVPVRCVPFLFFAKIFAAIRQGRAPLVRVKVTVKRAAARIPLVAGGPRHRRFPVFGEP
jgi:hypothetical protein